MPHLHYLRRSCRRACFRPQIALHVGCRDSNPLNPFCSLQCCFRGCDRPSAANAGQVRNRTHNETHKRSVSGTFGCRSLLKHKQTHAHTKLQRPASELGASAFGTAIDCYAALAFWPPSSGSRRFLHPSPLSKSPRAASLLRFTVTVPIHVPTASAISAWLGE